jgi:hypothetical protein
MIGGQVIFTGNAPPNTAVSVWEWPAPATVLAPLVDSYGRPIPNPVISDGSGNLVFYAAPGEYILSFVTGGNTVVEGIWIGQPVGSTQSSTTAFGSAGWL